MSVQTMRGVALPSGDVMPALGMGTWHLAQGRHPAEQEIAALRLGLDLGMTLVDTAEMYGDGAAERLVGTAIAGRRDDVFLVSKVLPHNATRTGTVQACRRSLERLGTDHLDLYLLHWRGPFALQETVAGFGDLQRQGLIRHWGVSNFGLRDLADLARIPTADRFEIDQVLYNLAHREIEWDLLPWCQQAGRPVMAYAPLGQGELIGHPVLRGIGARRRATSAQVALAWVIAHAGVSAVFEAGTPEHVRENRAAMDLRLHPEDLAELDAAFPPPSRPQPLEAL
jgi:diketogulonate reductase-like aldo/keto reductase